MKKKRFIPDIPTHNYQKGFDGDVLFHCLRDRLVFFTLFCTEAVRRGVAVLALDLMFTHTHSLVKVRKKEQLSRFNMIVETLYAKECNRQAGRKGHVFMKTYGWAQKKSSAKVRSALAYIANNAVEKRLFKHSLEDRWNILAYAKSDHPFSDPLIIRKATPAMKKAIKMVQGAHLRGRFLNYSMLSRLYSPLNQKERKQLTDFIIVTYNVVDFKAAAAYFGSFDKMIAAFDATTGSEYDLNEEYEPEPDVAYVEMARRMEKDGYDLAGKRFLTLSVEEKKQLASYLVRCTSATYRQACRFLHIPSAESGEQ